MEKLILFFLLSSFIQVAAQSDWPFYDGIQKFKKQDSLAFPQKNGVLFVGSSSIGRWKDLKERFAGYPIIHRGFGGSEYDDILHYADDIIIPYRPSSIFLYAGENDFVKGKTVDQVYTTFQKLYHKIRTELPESSVYFISVKPSGKLKEYRRFIETFNDKVKQLSTVEDPHLHYIDIYHLMLNEKREPKPELFESDQLHLTSEGYDLWEVAIRTQSSVFAKEKKRSDGLEIPPFQEKAERIPQYPLKTHCMIYRDDELAVALQSVERYPRAQEIKNKIVEAADEWLEWGDEDLRDLLTNAHVPRAFDLNAKGCPEHGSEIFNEGGYYPWIIDPSQSFKVKCPIGGEIYPTNDYKGYYLSNFKEKKGWNTEYVDEGWGWVAPDGERYWFVAYANHWLWLNHINPAILNLSRAYLLTGNQQYAHKVAIMLYKLAQVYPEMDYANQSRYGLMSKAENRTYDGKVVNLIWETSFIQNVAEAYDAIWDSIDDNIELQRFYGKNGQEICAFIEANLLEEALDAYFEGKIRGNYGMHQMSLMHILLARQNMDTKKYIQLLINEPSQDLSYAGIQYALYNHIFRDGQALESPGYNMIWVGRLATLSELLKKDGVDLFQNARLKMLFDSPLNMVATGKYTVDWGDTGTVLGGVVGRNADIYQIAHGVYKDPMYLDWLASINRSGGNSFSGFESLFREALPEAVALPNNRAVAEQPSRLFAGYGVGILNNRRDETAVAFTYGMHVFHYHWDFLNIELFANDQKMMPDLGYPDAMNAYVPEVYTWSNNTVNHNTVVVDAKKQELNQSGDLHDFSIGEFARTMSASSPAYVNVRQYRRNLIMVDVSDKESYIVDFFNVKGGKQHDYSLHGPPGAASARGGIWGGKQKGTFAGPAIELGELYDDQKLGAKDYKGGYAGYKGSGFQYLFNVQELKKGKGLVEYNHVRDKNARLRIHSLTKEPDGIYMADAYDKPRAKTHLLKYLIVRRKAKKDEELKSDFVSVIEPYRATAYIESSRLLALENGNGNVVEVVRKGEKDIIVNDTVRGVKKLVDYPIETDANSAVITIDDSGMLKRVFFSDGTYLICDGKRFETSSITGVVTQVNAETREITVKLDNKIKTLDKEQAYVSYFSNAHKSIVHPTLRIEKKRDLINISVKDDLLVGLLRVESTEPGSVLTTTALPFSPLYKGASVLDVNLNEVGTVKSINKGKLLYAKEPIKAPRKGDDLWLCTVGIGDKMEIKPVLSWMLKKNKI